MFDGLAFRRKLALFPLAAGFAFAFILAAAPFFSAQNEENLNRIRTAYLPTLEASRDLEDSLTLFQRGLQDAAAAEDPEALEAADEHAQAFHARLTELYGYGLRDREDVVALRQSFRAYHQLARSTTARMIGGDFSESTVGAMETMRTSYTEIRDALRTATATDRAEMDAAFDAAVDANSSSLYSYVGIALTALFLLVLLTLRITRGTTGQLGHVTRGFERLSAGDFSVAIDVVSGDELGDLARQANRMTEDLRGLFQTVSGSAAEVASSAAEMFAAVREQEAITTQQSAALEEVLRTVETLAESADIVSRDATEVSTMAAKSLETSESIAAHTRTVSEHSERIGNILQLIQEIADKSDILALNAALEGTRAGEVGRGFSLVAAEMRRLSEHVMDSVREIRKLVADTRESSHASVVATGGGIEVAKKTSLAAQSISRAVEAQRTGTEQVRVATDEVVTGVREVLSGTASAAESAEKLLQLSQELKSAVEAFRFEGDGDAVDDG